MEAHDQLSPEWFKQRYGKFTASSISNLLGIKGLGETGKSYCFKKAVEIVFGEDEEERFSSFDTERGIRLEPLAFAKFKELKEAEFLTVEKTVFFPYGEDAGASPDGVIGNDAVLEIKCPRSEKFFRLVAEGISAVDKEYIAQCQMQMMCSNSVRAHFFNYIIFNGKEYYHEIIIPRDEEMIAKIKERISEAIVIRDEYVKQLKANVQFK